MKINEVPEYVNEIDIHGNQVILFDNKDIKISKVLSLIFSSFQERDTFIKSIQDLREIKVNYKTK